MDCLFLSISSSVFKGLLLELELQISFKFYHVFYSWLSMMQKFPILLPWHCLHYQIWSQRNILKCLKGRRSETWDLGGERSSVSLFPKVPTPSRPKSGASNSIWVSNIGVRSPGSSSIIYCLSEALVGTWVRTWDLNLTLGYVMWISAAVA